ncbi:hypothetical protein F4808DRAFT_321754 [Astrocystis sublimbata]|nr:hypothetical protein F4808DRAFT_321754 [Astrocystis sublimbata]
MTWSWRARYSRARGNSSRKQRGEDERRKKLHSRFREEKSEEEEYEEGKGRQLSRLSVCMSVCMGVYGCLSVPNVDVPKCCLCMCVLTTHMQVGWMGDRIGWRDSSWDRAGGSIPESAINRTPGQAAVVVPPAQRTTYIDTKRGGIALCFRSTARQPNYYWFAHQELGQTARPHARRCRYRIQDTRL